MTANFVLMEAAALRGDEEAMLNAALAICQADGSGSSAYARIAAGRIRSAASASNAFRAHIAKLRLLAGSGRDLPALHLALVAAAGDGAPELNELQASRDSGLLTDWRIVGPFGTRPYADFDHQWAPERDGVSKPGYAGHKVEFFQFAGGQVKLPSYLAKDGVFYGSSQVYLRSDGDWRIFLESGGTLAIFIDGKRVLLRDDRRAPRPQSLRSDLKLSRGNHQIMVKFLNAAAPFRLAIMAPTGGLRPHPNIPSLDAAGSSYVSAALHYWEGDFAGAVEALTELLRVHPSASAHFLLARAWATADENAPEQLSEYEAALKLTPAAAAAEVAAGEIDLRARRTDAVLRRLARLLPPTTQGQRLPTGRVAGALELFAAAAQSLGWEADEEAALRALVERSASCKHLRRCADFFLSRQELPSARALEPRLPGSPASAAVALAGVEACSPLAYARLLADAGDHLAAANAAAQAIQRNLTDRSAHEFQVRQLMLAGLHQQAGAVARELQELAPNSGLFRELALQAEAGTTVFSRKPLNGPFYLPYRRDGREVAAKTAAMRFSGGPSAILLNDRIVDIHPDGRRRVYVHTLTRVLNREGIERYGEVELPQGARLLELRTLKADGSALEPELTQQKQTITMPALAPGDVIEREFVIDQPDLHWNEFTFGSLDAPTVSARLIVITPDARRASGQGGEAAESGVITQEEAQETPSLRLLGKNPVVRKQADGRLVRIWEQDDLRALPGEKNLPEADLFPAVRLRLPDESLKRHALDCSEAMLEASTPGVRAVLLARSLTAGLSGELEKTHVIASWVQNHIEPDSHFDCAELASAEDTLSSGSGSRSATFMALAQASGIDAGMVLARKLGADELPERFAYPLAEIHGAAGPSFAAGSLFIDLETENAAFGALPVALDRTQTLRLQLRANGDVGARSDAGLFTRIHPLNDGQERSQAEGNLTLTPAGELQAELLIRLGATRGAQLRGTMRRADSAARQQYLVQLAGRILPGATDVSGSVENADDNNTPMLLRLRCRVPEFVTASRTTLDLEQFLPGLGLPQTHAATPTRSLPLLLEDVLIERARFAVHLPPGVSLVHTPRPVRLNSPFGEYRLEVVSKGAQDFEIVRDFNIPAQLVSPGKYPGFRAFALRIDQVEREQVSFSWPAAKAGAKRNPAAGAG
jgi:tetratricopeptide (TPR) repeat protein